MAESVCLASDFTWNCILVVSQKSCFYTEICFPRLFVFMDFRCTKKFKNPLVFEATEGEIDIGPLILIPRQ